MGLTFPRIGAVVDERPSGVSGVVRHRANFGFRLTGAQTPPAATMTTEFVLFFEAA